MRTLTKELRRLRASMRAAQRGYVIILTALLLVPLVIVTAFAVDLGAWQVRGTELQRTADAAALAGVVELPDEDAAQTAVEQVVQANGFDLADYEVSLTPIVDPSANAAKLEVRILERSSDRYFSGIVLDEQTLARSATAEFIKPVKLGSPKNFLGTGDLLSGANQENVWLAISGYCASREQGERIAAYSDANFTTTSNPPGGGNSFASCLPGSEGGPSYVEENPEYEPDGYFYVVDVKEDFSGSLQIQVYDAAFCTGGATDAGDQGGSFTTTYTVRDDDSFDPADGTVIRQRVINPSSSTGSSSWCGRWRNLHTLGNPAAGRYYIQVQNQVGVTGQQGTNQFALRVQENGVFNPCTSDPSTASVASPFRDNCPGVHGLENMGAFANFSGTEPSFFLAELGPEHNNKTMEITLWDMGEGTERLRILDPLGNRATFRYTVLCNDGTDPVGGTCVGEANPAGNIRTGTTDNLDTSGSGHRQPGPHRLSSSRFNDRLLRLEIDLPADIDDAYGGNTWWRVQYRVGSSPSDRTTWSVIVRGDPVRLVP